MKFNLNPGKRAVLAVTSVLAAGVLSFLPRGLFAQPSSNAPPADAVTNIAASKLASIPTNRTAAATVVEKMRGLNMQPKSGLPSDGRMNAEEQVKQDLIKQLRAIGKEAVPALIHALTDRDAQMRRNAELAMIQLAGGDGGASTVDILEAKPALIKATTDGDDDVRAWAAHALAEIGPAAKDAVPALIKLLDDPYEGCRNDGCMALGRIGLAASNALPALRKALNDPSQDVRKFARRAIEQIEHPGPAASLPAPPNLPDGLYEQQSTFPKI
jgi:HEAT repeat protein